MAPAPYVREENKVRGTSDWTSGNHIRWYSSDFEEAFDAFATGYDLGSSDDTIGAAMVEPQYVVDGLTRSRAIPSAGVSSYLIKPFLDPVKDSRLDRSSLPVDHSSDLLASFETDLVESMRRGMERWPRSSKKIESGTYLNKAVTAGMMEAALRSVQSTLPYYARSSVSADLKQLVLKSTFFPESAAEAVAIAGRQVASVATQAVRARIDARLADLREYAAEDDEPFSEVSAAHLIAFCADAGLTKAPFVFLLANGNLRAIWDDRPRRNQIGLQFLEDGSVQSVILRLEGAVVRQQLSPSERPEMVRALVRTQDLQNLWLHG